MRSAVSRILDLGPLPRVQKCGCLDLARCVVEFGDCLEGRANVGSVDLW